MAKTKGMRKYYIGIGAISLAVLVATIAVIALSVGSREDRQRNKAAQEIADDLNDYIEKEYKIPESLKEASVDNDDENITYEKLSDERYEFCVTYTSGSDGSRGGIDDGVILDSGREYDDYYGSYEPSRLYVSSYYTAGQDCETIKPYIPSYRSNDDYYQSLCDDDFYADEPYCQDYLLN